MNNQPNQNSEHLITYLRTHLSDFCAPCLLDDLEQFIKTLHYKGASFNTIKSYINDLKQSFAFFSNSRKQKISLQTLLAMNINDFRELIASFATKSASTQERLIAAWKKWIQFKAQDNIFVDFHKIQYPKMKKKSFIPTQPEDIKKLLSTTCSTWQELRMQAFITLLYTTGLRINEALNLKWDDIQNNNGRAYCKVKGKGSKLRYVPVLAIALEKLQDYKEALKTHSHNDFEYVFIGAKLGKWHACTAEREFRNLVAQLNLPKEITPHSLRHACATHLLKAGCNLRSIQNLLGHSNLETTKIYIQYSTEELQQIHANAIK